MKEPETKADEGISPVNTKEQYGLLRDYNAAWCAEENWVPPPKSRSFMSLLREFHKFRSLILYKILKMAIPMLSYINSKQYTQKDLISDLVAGCTAGAMLVTQGISYAVIAKLPPQIGLYSTMIASLVYPVFSSSRHLSVGPGSLISMIAFEGVSTLVSPTLDDETTLNPVYLQYCVTVAFLSGIIQLLMGIFHLGIIIDFLSKPVASAFTSAGALLIILSQVSDICGFKMEKETALIGYAKAFINHADSTHLPTLLVGIICLVILILFKKRFFLRSASKAYKIIGFIPAQLCIVIVTTLVASLIDIDKRFSVDVLGPIPSGFPSFSLPRLLDLPDGHFTSLLLTALSLTVIGLVESIAAANIYATHFNYKISNNRELNALGLMNFVGGFLSCYPTTGGFSRTAVSVSAGAKSPISQLVGGVIVVLTVLFLTPAFYYLPKSTLATIVCIAVSSLCNLSEFSRLFRISTIDFALHTVTLLATLFLGVMQGIAIGVGLSCLLIFYRAAKPSYAVLGVYSNLITLTDGSPGEGGEDDYSARKKWNFCPALKNLKKTDEKVVEDRREEKRGKDRRGEEHVEDGEDKDSWRYRRQRSLNPHEAAMIRRREDEENHSKKNNASFPIKSLPQSNPSTGGTEYDLPNKETNRYIVDGSIASQVRSGRSLMRRVKDAPPSLPVAIGMKSNNPFERPYYPVILRLPTQLKSSAGSLPANKPSAEEKHYDGDQSEKGEEKPFEREAPERERMERDREERPGVNELEKKTQPSQLIYSPIDGNVISNNHVSVANHSRTFSFMPNDSNPSEKYPNTTMASNLSTRKNNGLTRVDESSSSLVGMAGKKNNSSNSLSSMVNTKPITSLPHSHNHTPPINTIEPSYIAYLDMYHSKNALPIPGVIIFRFHSDLFFANSETFRNALEREIKNAREASTTKLNSIQYQYLNESELLSLEKYITCSSLHTIVLDMSSISLIDSSASLMLHDLFDRLDMEGVAVLICNVKHSTLRDLQAMRLLSRLTCRVLFPSVHAAVSVALYVHQKRIENRFLDEMGVHKREAQKEEKREERHGDERRADDRRGIMSPTIPADFVSPISSATGTAPGTAGVILVSSGGPVNAIQTSSSLIGVLAMGSDGKNKSDLMSPEARGSGSGDSVVLNHYEVIDDNIISDVAEMIHRLPSNLTIREDPLNLMPGEERLDERRLERGEESRASKFGSQADLGSIKSEGRPFPATFSPTNYSSSPQIIPLQPLDLEGTMFDLEASLQFHSNASSGRKIHSLTLDVNERDISKLSERLDSHPNKASQEVLPVSSLMLSPISHPLSNVVENQEYMIGHTAPMLRDSGTEHESYRVNIPNSVMITVDKEGVEDVVIEGFLEKSPQLIIDSGMLSIGHLSLNNSAENEQDLSIRTPIFVDLSSSDQGQNPSSSER